MTENADRRSSHRFPLHLVVKCRWIEPHTNADRTVLSESLNISSKGLVLAPNEAFEPGQVIEASIDWPMLLDKRVPLTLIVEGEVVRKGPDHTAVRIDKYQFKTRKAG